MSLTLYYHPLSSFCWEVLIALYENDTPFQPHLVDLGNLQARTQFLKRWPIGKFPVLQDGARNQLVPESTIIIEYLAQHYPGYVPLVPADADQARNARLQYRLLDQYVQEPMQKIVGDRLRPAGQRDAPGTDAARAQIETAYSMIEAHMVGRTRIMGDAFTLADCAAFPALYYANVAVPLSPHQRNVAAYLARMEVRRAVTRVLAEAEPHFQFFPLNAERRRARH